MQVVRGRRAPGREGGKKGAEEGKKGTEEGRGGVFAAGAVGC